MEHLFDEYGLAIIEVIFCAVMCAIFYHVLEIVWASLDSWGALI